VPVVAPRLATPARLVSLDAFRGLTMAGMTIVNNPGDWKHVYPPLLHAEWNGWTPTDLVFPFFVFIVGVAITLSRKTAHWTAILRRSLVLIGLGLLLNGFPFYDLSQLRFPGVLQRIGVCYLAAALLYRWLRQTAPADDPGAGDRRSLRLTAEVAAVLLVGYWAILVLVPGASGARGDLTPEGNIGAVIDRAVFGTHLYRTTWDPEGLLSTIPAIGTALLGMMAGLWMRLAGDLRRVAAGLAAGGLAAVAVGYLWGFIFPINKNLWTSSYTLFTGGLASLLFAACYAVIDVAGWRRAAYPLVVLGSNAIALYVLSGLLSHLLGSLRVNGASGEPVTLKTMIYSRVFAPVASPVNASLLFAVANLVVMFVVLWGMYKRGVFLKV
jgi:predicted acyltransferase